MENIDAGMARRVWQRVQGAAAEPMAENTPTGDLIFQSHALAGLYWGLQRRLTGQATARAKELHRQHKELTACLKGISLVSNQTVSGLPPINTGSGTVRNILLGCFHRERRLGDGLACRAGDPVLGSIWQLLAGQALKRAVAVLELLGEIQEQER